MHILLKALGPLEFFVSAAANYKFTSDGSTQLFVIDKITLHSYRDNIGINAEDVMILQVGCLREKQNKYIKLLFG